jgi:DNA-directed RNA polymerase specialized sigma24 family protein
MTTSVDTFPNLYDIYASAIYGCISRAFVDEETANAVFEKTFVLIFRNIHQYSPGHSTIFTWMNGIVQQEINAAKNDKPGLVLQF